MTNSTNFLKRLKGITLSKNEQLALRERLSAYMELHPVEESEKVSNPYTNFFVLFSSRRFTAYAFSLLLVISAGGGFALAADTSLPGDAMYGIKIHVNEPLMIAFTPTNVGQARLSAHLATRRVDEAVTLASKGKLTEEKRTYLAQAFDTEIKRTEKRTGVLEQTGDSENATAVKADLAANLAGEAQALGALSNGSENGARAFLSIIVATSDSLDDSIGSSLPAHGTDLAPTLGAGKPGKVKEGTVPPPQTALVTTKLASTTQSHDSTKVQLTGRFGHRLFFTATTTLRGGIETNTLSVPAVQTDSIQSLPKSILPSAVRTENDKHLEGLSH